MDSPAERPVDNSRYPGSHPRLTAEAVLPRLRSVLDAIGDVDFAYLFGSVAKGRAHASSDIDVAIHFSCVFAAADDRLRLADHTLKVEGLLERELRRPVRVVGLNTAPLRLRQNVLQHGLLAVVRDDDARRRFYVEHARRYHDLDHARRISHATRAGVSRKAPSVVERATVQALLETIEQRLARLDELAGAGLGEYVADRDM